MTMTTNSKPLPPSMTLKEIAMTLDEIADLKASAIRNARKAAHAAINILPEEDLMEMISAIVHRIGVGRFDSIAFDFHRSGRLGAEAVKGWDR